MFPPSRRNIVEAQFLKSKTGNRSSGIWPLRQSGGLTAASWPCLYLNQGGFRTDPFQCATAANSQPTRYASGWSGLISRPYIESGSPWENGDIESFMPVCVTNCSMARSSKASKRCGSSPASRTITTTGHTRTAAWLIAPPGPGNDQDASLSTRLRCTPPPHQVGIEGAHQPLRNRTSPDRRCSLDACHAPGSSHAGLTRRPRRPPRPFRSSPLSAFPP
jgi:hypothetical protein